MTPAGRLFLRPEMDQIINSVFGVKNPLDVEAIKTEIANSMMLKHPRFCSLMVRDPNGREYWRKTQIDIDRHVIVKPDRLDGDDDEDAANDYLADLSVSSPLSADKPLWEIHLLTAHKCAVVRIHHALGDGISLMSLFLACFRRADLPDQIPTFGSEPQTKQRSGGRRNPVWELLTFVWYTLVYAVEFVLRSLWVKDRKTPISGGAGVELWPRKLATAKFRLDDMKAVKTAIPNAVTTPQLYSYYYCHPRNITVRNRKNDVIIYKKKYVFRHSGDYFFNLLLKFKKKK